MHDFNYAMPSFPFDLQAPLTRNFTWELQCEGATFRVETRPPEGHPEDSDHLEFWLTRTDIPESAQLSYYVISDEHLFKDCLNVDLVDLVMQIHLQPCYECNEPAIGNGPCETDHHGLCEMCYVADKHGTFARANADRVAQAEEHVAHLNKSIKNGFRFTLLIEGVTHENCDDTCMQCDCGRGDEDREDRFEVFERQFQQLPRQRTINRIFDKQAFWLDAEVDVMETAHWLEDCELKLQLMRKCQRDFLVAKDATTRALEISESAAAHLIKSAADTRTPPAGKRN